MNLGGRFTLTSGMLQSYAQVDLIHLERLFPRESMVAFMVTQMTGWTSGAWTLEAGFRYAATLDRRYAWSVQPRHEVFGGFVGAWQHVGRLDCGLTLGLIRRTGLLTHETELPALLDVSCRLGIVRPTVALGWTGRRIWPYEREAWAETAAGQPFVSVSVCFVPMGQATDSPARMLMPRDVFYSED